jgi:hypothetical protein
MGAIAADPDQGFGVSRDGSSFRSLSRCEVLPSLIFKRSFHTYVLEHFRVNGVAAMPVLYRLA